MPATHDTPHLLQGYGLELEYMIVGADTLDVLPVADRLLAAGAGGGEAVVDDVERGRFEWSNELALHVVEMKTRLPEPGLAGLGVGFQGEVRAMNELLAPLGAMLLPTAMHPWMEPLAETRLWPHGHRAVYEAYNRIFGCQGHGWSNLQSVHLNLAFNGDHEFGRLHAAIRLLLPLIPALAASSPFVEGCATGVLDNRLAFYRQNQRRVPSLTGQVIPEAVFTRAEYEEEILKKNYHDIAPFDPEAILRDEWLNSRGAIARFQRSAIEIRLVDIQECPAADLAVISLLVAVIRFLVAERWSSIAEQRAMPIAPLLAVLEEAIRQGEEAVVREPAYLRLLGLGPEALSLGELCRHLAAETIAPPSPGLDIILEQGPLARRLLRAVGPRPSREELRRLYRRLGRCLAEGEMFVG